MASKFGRNSHVKNARALRIQCTKQRRFGRDMGLCRPRGAITEVLWLLAEHPRIGRVRDELDIGLRRFPVGNVVIAYEVSDDDVSVLRIVHGGRDLGHCLMADRDGNKPAING